MVFPIAGGNESKGYDISNSLRFNDGDSPQLSLSTGTTNKRTFTVSVWAKRCTNGARQTIWASDKSTNDTGDGSKGGSGIHITFWNDDQLYFGGFGGSFQVRADGVQRDNSAWYHIVAQVDTTQSTTNDRGKLWINGVQQTTYTSMIGQNVDVKFATNRVGVKSETANYSDSDSLTHYADSYITELHVIDGTAYDHTQFGEFDNNNVWIPKKYTGSYGSDGYYLEFQQTGTSQNSSGIGADTSGNDNHFAVTNLAATDITEDTCTNNFATLNPLYKQGSPTYSEGNCKVVLPTGDNNNGAAGSIAVSSGKWYWEVKHVSSTQSSILVREVSDREDYLSYAEGNFAGYERLDGNQRVTGNTESTYGASYTSNDIIMVALDMDNDRVYFGKNGSWNDGSGNADEANLNDYVTLTGIVDGVAAVANGNAGATATFEFNFGNAPYAISSGNTDGKYGNFEYAPPSGYYALCTKRLAEFG